MLDRKGRYDRVHISAVPGLPANVPFPNVTKLNQTDPAGRVKMIENISGRNESVHGLPAQLN